MNRECRYCVKITQKKSVCQCSEPVCSDCLRKEMNLCLDTGRQPKCTVCLFNYANLFERPRAERYLQLSIGLSFLSETIIVYYTTGTARLCLNTLVVVIMVLLLTQFDVRRSRIFRSNWKDHFIEGTQFLCALVCTFYETIALLRSTRDNDIIPAVNSSRSNFRYAVTTLDMMLLTLCWLTSLLFAGIKLGMCIVYESIVFLPGYD